MVCALTELRVEWRDGCSADKTPDEAVIVVICSGGRTEHERICFRQRTGSSLKSLSPPSYDIFLMIWASPVFPILARKDTLGFVGKGSYVSLAVMMPVWSHIMPCQ